MSIHHLKTAAICSLLIGVGSVAFWLELRPELVVDARELTSFEYRVGPWIGQSVPLESTVEALLRADANVQRAYIDPAGATVWLYIGYYGTARGGRPEHTPCGCYTGAGWSIEASRVITDDGTPANEYAVTRDGERRLVHFWYRSQRQTGLLGGLDQNLDRINGRLANGRADGALVRLSTRVGNEGERLARDRRTDRFAVLDSDPHMPGEFGLKSRPSNSRLPAGLHRRG